MIKNTVGKIKRNYSCITEIQKASAKAYILDAVNSFYKNNRGSEISVRILFGGENRDWRNTPLQCIYEYHKYSSHSKSPEKSAAITVGWLLKEVLNEDKNQYECSSRDSGNRYKIIK